jgi:hypothetical protein
LVTTGLFRLKSTKLSGNQLILPKRYRMRKVATLQLTGPIALFCAVSGSEAAAYGLSRMPKSEWLWYLNLKWFSMFQESHYALRAYVGVDCEQFLCIALPLFLVACAGIALKRSLILAISSNLSFVYIAFVFYTWFRVNSHREEASLAVSFGDSSSPDLMVLAVLVGLSLLSFVVSHISYIQRASARA